MSTNICFSESDYDDMFDDNDDSYKVNRTEEETELLKQNYQVRIVTFAVNEIWRQSEGGR